jgi:spore coat polysaccharide biosynthesis protein SpsF
MKTAIFITVRMKSTRLPKKALLEIKSKPTIGHLIERMKMAKKPAAVFVCTSTHPDDAVLCEVAGKYGAKCFRGSPEDKLQRYLDAADKYGIEFAIIVDGDDILCSWEYADNIIERYEKTNADVIFCRGLPLGMAPSGLKISAIRKVCSLKSESDTEVWGGYFTKPGLFKIEYLDAEPDEASDARLTLDYQEDLDFFRAVFKGLPGKKIFYLKEVIKFLKNNPDIRKINKVAQEKYEEHIKKSAPVRFKNIFAKK